MRVQTASFAFFEAVFALAVDGAGCRPHRPVASREELARQGAALFQQRCALCHSTGERAAQGPGLGGVVLRAAAGQPGFAYSSALRASGLLWNEATLDRFLAAPSLAVPGTTMPIAVPDGEDRRALVTYLGTLRPGSASPISGGAGSDASPWNGDDFRTDRPGRRTRVELRDMPPPYASLSANNGPSVVPPPPGALPRVPPDFEITRFASDLKGPRQIKVAPNGDVFVVESSEGRVRALRAPDGSKVVSSIETWATGLDRPFGLAFYPPGPKPEWLYVANTTSVVRFRYREGARGAEAPPEIVVANLIDAAGGHWTRDLAFSSDGQRMFVSVGSGSNVAEGMPSRAASEAPAWEAAHGLGASWGGETDRADVLVFTPQGQNRRTFAAGLRNCVGLSFLASSQELWCAVNERDALGDELVPDYVTHVSEGAFYGWPWFYLGAHEDPRHAGERPDLVAKVTVPDALLPAHSAPLGIAFYDASAFAPGYRGDLFAALHGSWNRAARRGPKVVRVLFRDGAPTGEIEDFVTGFTVDDDHVWGRPVGVAVAHDGALLVTEDANGSVWRVQSLAGR